MASVCRKRRSPYWYACYTDADGVQQQVTTKLTNRGAAQKIAEAYEAVYRRKLTEVQVRRTMSEIFEAVNGESLCHFTLKEWFATWLARVKPEVGPKTYLAYEGMTKTVVRFAPDLLAKPLDRIEPKHVLDLRQKLVEARSSSSVNSRLKVFGICMKAAWVEGLIPENPVARVGRVKLVREVAKRPFTMEELKAVLAAANDEWRGLILAGLYTAGQRLSDLVTMTPENVDLKADIVRFSTDKTGRDVIVPITAPWRADLAQRVASRKAGQPLFPTAHARFLKSGNSVGRISNAFRRLLARVGLSTNPNKKRDGAIKGRRLQNALSFHSLRHTATSMLKNAGVSDSVARDIVGHESQAVSANYTHIEEATKRAAMEKLPDINAV